jgi:hypothetical protein
VPTSLNRRRKVALLIRNVLFHQGLYRAMVTDGPVEIDGQPTPWFTLPAVSYIRSMDLSSHRVFEWGSGLSTVFWAARAASVTSVEDNEDWFLRMKPKLESGNVDYRLVMEEAAYVSAVGEDFYDLIVIDGSHRERCAETAASRLSPHGLIILDNSEWHPLAAETLRGAGLIEVDFAGLSAANSYTSVTSLFVRPTFRPTFATDHPPVPIGGIPDNVRH